MRVFKPFASLIVNMKLILLITAVAAILTTTGCLVEEGGHREHVREHGEIRGEVVVAPPVVVVPTRIRVD
jgi:hypothetical protein